MKQDLSGRGLERHDHSDTTSSPASSWLQTCGCMYRRTVQERQRRPCADRNTNLATLQEGPLIFFKAVHRSIKPLSEPFEVPPSQELHEIKKNTSNPPGFQHRQRRAVGLTRVSTSTICGRGGGGGGGYCIQELRDFGADKLILALSNAPGSWEESQKQERSRSYRACNSGCRRRQVIAVIR